MHWLSWIGIVLIAVGTALTIMGQKKDGDQANQSLRDSNMQIEKLSKENIELTKKAADLNNEIAAIVTGGNSYCYLEPLLYGEKDIVDLLLEIRGTYPMYDVKITITDFEKMKAIRNSEKYRESEGKGLSMLQSTQQFAESRRILNIGNLSANLARSLGTLPLSSQGKQSYKIAIEARNGFVEQYLKFIKVKGKWAMAQRLIVNGEPVREHSMPEFPKDENGKIDWSD